MTVPTVDHAQCVMPPGGEADARAFHGAILAMARSWPWRDPGHGAILGFEEVAKRAAPAARGGARFVCGTVLVHPGADEAFRPGDKAHAGFAVGDPAGFSRDFASGWRGGDDRRQECRASGAGAGLMSAIPSATARSSSKARPRETRTG